MPYGLEHQVREVIAFAKTGSINPSFDADLALLRRGVSLQHSNIQLPENTVTADLIIQLPQIASNDNAFEKLSPKEYFKLVQSVICQGVAFQKKVGIYAFRMFPLQIVTQNSADDVETKAPIPMDKIIVFDAAHYTREQAQSIVRFIFTNYGQMLSSTDLIAQDFLQAINNGELAMHCDVKGYGIWTMTPKNFKNDYEFSQTDNFYKVKVGTTRFCIDVDRDFVMPVQWGEFLVRKNGTVAARIEELPQIIKALEDVQSGRKTVQEAFYTAEGNARFDIYGMDPNFRQDNYNADPQPVSPLVQAAIQKYLAILG